MQLPHPVKTQFHEEYQALRDAGATLCEAIEQIAISNELLVEEVLSQYAFTNQEVFA
jgi:hypothetical protein